MNFNISILEQGIQNLILNVLFTRWEMDDGTSNVKELCINIAKF